MRLPPDFDWRRLSARGRVILRQVALPISEGVSYEEVAERLGRSRRWVARCMDELKAELAALAGAEELPPLAGEEYEALKADIEARGVIVPVLVDERGGVIDGRHRLRACEELGVDCPRTVAAGLGESEKRSLALALNLARRHLSQAQRRRIVEAELRRDPGRSDRQIAALCGSSPTTVGAARRGLEERGDVSRLDTRRDSAGRDQPAAREPRPEPAHAAEPETLRVVVEASELEVAAWRRAAQRLGLPLPEWMRETANAEAAALEAMEVT